MKTVLTYALFTILSLPLGTLSAQDQKMERTTCIDEKEIKAFMVSSEELKWEDALPPYHTGIKVAKLIRNSTCDGNYVTLLKLPKNYQTKPHIHSTLEQVTVISGVLHFGVGDVFDKSQSKALSVGSFIYCPGGTHHFFWTDEETILLIHGTGPLGTVFINP